MRGILGLILLGMSLDGFAKDLGTNRANPVHHLITSTLRFRRTEEGVPTSDLGCQTADEFFKKVEKQKLRECLNQIQKGSFILYDLKRSSQPVLRLKEDEFTPECLKANLPEIPVPREIVFESNESGATQCYAVRLKVEANEWVGARFPVYSVALKLSLPMTSLPQKDEEWIATLVSWSLTPYWEENPATLSAYLVPDAACNACIGEKNRIRGAVHRSQLWP